MNPGINRDTVVAILLLVGCGVLLDASFDIREPDYGQLSPATWPRTIVGILTILSIAVAERTAEIGLLRAVGATRGAVLLLFLGEATLIAAIGGLAGLALGWGLAGVLKLALPALPVHTPWLYAVLAEAVAVVVGLSAGVLPARRAAQLDPLEALRGE